MKNLHKYLVEKFEITNAVNFIQDVISNPDENEKIIRAGYYAMAPQVKNDFYLYCKDNLGFNNDQFSAVWRIFEQHDAFDIAQIIMNQGGIIEPDVILRTNKISNILSVVPQHVEIDGNMEGLDIDKNMITELVEAQPGKGGIAVGPSELFLCLFVKSCMQNPNKTGDLLMGTTNLEVKGETALLQGQKNKAQPQNLYKNFAKYYSEIYYEDDAGCLSGKTKVENILAELKAANIDIAEFTEKILIGDGRKDDAYYADDYGITKEYIRFLKTTKLDNADDWLRSIALYGAMIYQRAEKFDSIIMVNNSTKKFMVFDIANQSYKNLWNMVKPHWWVNTAIHATDGRKSLPKITLK